MQKIKINNIIKNINIEESVKRRYKNTTEWKNKFKSKANQKNLKNNRLLYKILNKIKKWKK